tara:strand:+ start:48 stop:572 length:525 start_codon:yes stop_codon:yes gene_type:complete
MIVDKNFLSDKSIDFIENYIMTNNFPFYMQYEAVSGDNIKNMCHVVLPRVEERAEMYVKHPHHKSFVNILDDFCIKNLINYDEIYRIAINLTYHNGISDKSPTHCDHKFEHNQLLVYLNDPLDKKASTVLLNDNDEVYNEIYPEKYKGLFFSKMSHYLKFPKIGERYILVITFR